MIDRNPCSRSSGLGVHDQTESVFTILRNAQPPAFRSHLVPIACGTPAATAASSLALPDAIAAQNRRRSSRPATGGRPGDNNGGRLDRAERRFRLVIATSSLKVLRRSVEFTQYTSIEFGHRCRQAGVRPSMGSVGDAYDNAMCESFFATSN